MSSSSSGQWTPRLPPLRRQVDRSLAVACSSRGYQPSGTAMVRPSDKSTVKVSSVTFTSVARAFSISAIEKFIPTLQQLQLVLFDQVPNPFEFFATEAAVTLQTRHDEPELCLVVVAFD